MWQLSNYSNRIVAFKYDVQIYILIFSLFQGIQIQIDDIDWECSGLSHSNSATPGVTVPELECPLSAEDIATLHLNIDPLSHYENFGKDIYLTTLTHAL